MTEPDASDLARVIALSVDSRRSSRNMESHPGKHLKEQIRTELLRVEPLPQTQLALLLAPLLEPITQAVQAMQLLQERWRAWIQENRDWLAEVRARVSTYVVAVTQVSVQFEEALNQVERFASAGWTLPTQLSLPELIEFLALADGEMAVAYLMGKLETSDPEFRHMEERLQKNPLLREFPTVLPQCFRAMRSQDYAIAIPSLVAMLERIIQQLNPPQHHANTNVLVTLREPGQVARKAQEELFCAALWLSLLRVVEGLWKQFPLETPSTPVLSRPGIQHGRVEPPNKKSEVIRLLNTLETALALHEILDDAEPLSREESSSERQAMRPFLALLHAHHFLPRGKWDATGSDLTASDSETRDESLSSPGPQVDLDGKVSSSAT